MVSAARSRDIRFTFIIQNFAQLNDVYGKEVAEIIKGNCGNIIYLISTELAALEEISKMCGEVKSKEKDKTASTPLVTISDLQKLKLFEAIIIRLRKNPFKTKLEPDFKMDWGMTRSEAEYPNREIQKIELFDVKKYVTEEKRKQMMNNLENNGGAGPNPFNNNFGNPFTPTGMNPMNSNPFMPNPGASPNNHFAPNSPNPFNPGNNNMNSFGPKPINSAPNPFNNQTPNGTNPASAPSTNANSPFSSNPMFNKPMSSLSDADIDAMMKDIDRRLKELDEEEARQKAAMNKANNPVQETEGIANKTKLEDQEFTFSVPEVKEPEVTPKENIIKPDNNGIESLEDTHIKNETPIEIKQNKEEVSKPKINVDADSIIVNENVITDDEFFDDFFNE